VSGRRRKGHHEEHHVDERWLVSYADMITVLMALFIVLYAMSTVDQHKYDELKNSLATGFGVTKSAKVDENKAIVPKKYVTKDGSGFSKSTIALMQVAKQIQDELKAAGVNGKAVVKAGSNSVTISLIGSSTYFDGNQANLRPEALKVLRVLSPTLHKHAGSVTIEGHADPRGSSGSYGNDWNLAAARANSVLVWLVDHNALDPADISSISYGSEHAATASSASAIEKNRRVDIVLHSVTLDSTATATPAPTTSVSTADAAKASATASATPAATAEATSQATAKATEAASH
jgi:chemotaxis protein MotB